MVRLWKLSLLPVATAIPRLQTFTNQPAIPKKEFIQMATVLAEHPSSTASVLTQEQARALTPPNALALVFREF